MSIKLWEYDGKNVEVLTVDNKRFRGKVILYLDKDELDDEEDSISIENENGITSITESEVKEIKEQD